MPSREAAYAALAARLQSKLRPLLARDVSRKLLALADVDPIEQPAAFVIATDESFSGSSPMPSPETLGAMVVVYARCDSDPATTAETTLHAIIDAIRDALRLQDDEVPAAPAVQLGQQFQFWSTLGGNVAYVKPSGTVQLYSGASGQQGVAQIPIEMLLPPT
jgi:hypothetical protein